MAETMHHVVAKQLLIIERVRDETVEEYLDRIAQVLGVQRDDEHTYDTHDFPKVLLEVAWEDGVPYLCTSCQEEL